MERQKQRNVSDADIVRAIKQGVLSENDSGHSYQLENLKVTVDYHQEILITVHPGDPALKSTKLLSKEEAKKLISQLEKQQKPEDKEANEFLSYVKDFKVKKI
jgi:hypothetical protein